MEQLRTYILSVVAAAILCGILERIAAKSGSGGTVLKLISGLVLSICVLSPAARISFEDFSGYWEQIQLDGAAIAASGTDYASESMQQRIVSQTEAYILDKAQQLGLTLSVEVAVTDDALPVPKSVILHGNASPYAKNQIQTMLRDELGIPKEAQTWN